ncbi:hypothetical protein EKG38_06115 [Shewanella canadensis]|uniref:Uncharacterized protein n=1 Tax=Shewanella canadensis TaxID=271096 RepID=A0A431WXY4_9GAMM|nr:hypothetical protein [Shewanella canadensis]RTR40288.1 hypothetical protein EKG38_06115 [Shewanella canadensis]
MKIVDLEKVVQKLIDKPINKTLVSLVSYMSGNGTGKAKFIKALRNKRICSYQSKLLKKYLKHPKKYLTLEIDKLDFTVSYNRKATKFIKAITCKSKGLLQVSPSLQPFITVEAVRLDAINKACHKDQKNRPHYILKFEVRVKGKPEAVLSIHLADGSKSDYKGLRFSFNPRHFSALELAAVFSHIYKVLGAVEYNNVMAKARVTRVDVAVNLPGISSVFLLFMPPHGNSQHSTCYPETEGAICETLYIGPFPKDDDFDRTRKSKYRIYCWLLNKLKSGCELNISEHTVAARLEYELNCWDNQRGLMLTNLNDALVKLDCLQIIDPLDFHHIPEKWHRELLVNKSISNIRKRLSPIKKKLNKHNGFNLLALNSRWTAQEQAKALTELKCILTAPKSMFKELSDEA